jgi:glutathione S-transferase
LKNEFGYEFGPKGKVPFITLNGEDVADSQFVIEYLSKKFNVNFSSNYSPEQNGIARAFFKLTEESFFWTMVLTRFVYEPNSKAVGIPSFLIKIMASRIKGRSKAQGYGLHSERELQSIRNADLDAINSFIGNKKYLLGDKVCDADAALFGMLAQTYFHDRGSSYDYLTCKKFA